jgi:hypothetical protein
VSTFAIAEANKRIDALQKRVEQIAGIVCEQAKRIAALERATPPHLANLERREFKPTINGIVAGPVTEQHS